VALKALSLSKNLIDSPRAAYRALLRLKEGRTGRMIGLTGDNFPFLNVCAKILSMARSIGDAPFLASFNE
jgi:hypothetical protein